MKAVILFSRLDVFELPKDEVSWISGFKMRPLYRGVWDKINVRVYCLRFKPKVWVRGLGFGFQHLKGFRVRG